jgi:hypothetical protein
MVEYFDRQVEVVAVECVKRGEVGRRSKEKFDIEKVVGRQIPKGL